jgi:hypothetical protein
MENYILLCVFIMFLIGVFAVCDFCISILERRKAKARSSKFFDYKL